MKRITVLLEGGIGNQLWQVAYAHYLSEKIFPNFIVQVKSRYGAGFVLNGLENYCQHIVFLKEHPTLHYKFKERLFFHKLSGLPRLKHLTYCDRNHDGNKLSGKTRYVWGDFQNVFFLESYPSPFPSEVLNWLDSYNSDFEVPANWTTVHIRRGDYTHPLHLPVIGLLKKEYFKQALIALDVSELNLIVFSDCSTVWEIEENYALSPKVFFGKQKSDLESLNLLSRSRSIVMSNSTWSWWGAYIASKRFVHHEVKFALPFPFFKNYPKLRQEVDFQGVIFVQSQFENH